MKREKKETFVNRTLKTFVASCATALMALGPAGAGAQDKPMAKGETLTMQSGAGTLFGIHALIASKKGYCERYGFKCELKNIIAGAAALQAVIGKSMDLGLPAAELAVTAVSKDAPIQIVAMGRPSMFQNVIVRSDVPLPNKAQGYAGILRDLRGKKIGITSRGSGSEILFTAMLKAVGMSAADVTYVGVGGPGTAYTALVVGKQVDAVVNFQPLDEICAAQKTCFVAINLTNGEGPPEVSPMGKAALPFVMRRDLLESNPTLVRALLAAFNDAETWFSDPANFNELVEILKPTIDFGTMPGAEQLRIAYIKSELPRFSHRLKVDRQALQGVIDFSLANKLIDKPIKVSDLVWEGAP